MDGSHSVRCTCCNVLVTGAEALRAHYRSDIHLVNVKRRVSGLGGLSVEEFTRRVQALQAAKNEQQKGKRSVSCDVCQKRFASQKSLQNHEMSKRHRDKVRSLNYDGSDWMSSIHSASEVAEEREHSLDDDMEWSDEHVEQSLRERMTQWETHSGFGGVFDDMWFESADEALQHLQKGGMFVPFRDRLRDVHGLVRYLSQKVGVGYACIQCDRTFGSAQAARKHMRDVGHCGMTDEDEAWMMEYGEFYDWSGGAADDEDGWEEVDEWEGVHGEHVVVDVGEGRDETGGRPMLALEKSEEDGREEVGLVVGDKVLGHRSLGRYYRQSGRVRADSAAVVAVRQERRITELSRRAREGRLPVRMRELAAAREKRFALAVGRRNYYTRKARIKQRMVVLNSGYRA